MDVYTTKLESTYFGNEYLGFTRYWQVISCVSVKALCIEIEVNNYISIDI